MKKYILYGGILLSLVIFGSAPVYADSYAFGNTGSAPLAELTLTLSNGGTTQTLTLYATDQGWFSPTPGVSNVSTNTNYIVGTVDGAVYNDFFTFDLSSVTGTVTSATLGITQGSAVFNYVTQSLAFGGSSCTSATLDNPAANSTCDNLENYVSWNVPSDLAGTLELIPLDLDSAAVEAINGPNDGDFSVVGSLETCSPPHCPVEKSGGKTGITTIGMDYEAPASLTGVPEPSGLLLLGTGLVFLFFLRKL